MCLLTCDVLVHKFCGFIQNSSLPEVAVTDDFHYSTQNIWEKQSPEMGRSQFVSNLFICFGLILINTATEL